MESLTLPNGVSATIDLSAGGRLQSVHLSAGADHFEAAIPVAGSVQVGFVSAVDDSQVLSVTSPFIVEQHSTTTARRAVHLVSSGVPRLDLTYRLTHNRFRLSAVVGADQPHSPVLLGCSMQPELPGPCTDWFLSIPNDHLLEGGAVQGGDADFRYGRQLGQQRFNYLYRPLTDKLGKPVRETALRLWVQDLLLTIFLRGAFGPLRAQYAPDTGLSLNLYGSTSGTKGGAATVELFLQTRPRGNDLVLR